MTSVTVSTQIEPSNSDTEETEHIADHSCPTDRYKYSFPWPVRRQVAKTARAMSYNDERIQSTSPPSSSATSHNRFRHLCTRLKRRLSITKDYRTHSEDMDAGVSVRLSNYKSFSSSVDDSNNEYQWPDFEKVYESIPNCLLRALPGLNDICNDDEDDDEDADTEAIKSATFLTDDNDEQTELFEQCRRGKYFRRNAICQKLDKTQYNGQWDTFIQQLMIEKLMRTWT